MREYLKINESNALKAMLRNFAFSITQKMKSGMLFAIGFFGTTILAVAISGTIKTWTTGEVLKSADLNTTVASLKTAIEGIPNWTKAANGNDAYYTAGNVGIGTASPSAGLQIVGSVNLDAAHYNLGLKTSPTDGFATGYGIKNNSGVANAPGGGSSAIAYQAFGSNAWLSFYTGGSLTANAAVPERMRIDFSGNVGIGTTTPAYKLDVAGDVQVYNCFRYFGGTLGSCSSDRRLKKDIEKHTYKDALNKLSQFELVKYKMKSKDEMQYIGFIAQDIEKIAPELVSTGNDGYKTLDYASIQWMQFQGIQELKNLYEKEKAANEKKLLSLEEDNKRLRETVETLRVYVETHGRASLRLEDRLRAIENTQMARK